MLQINSIKPHDAGFTLLEVMLALLILAISLTAVYTALSQNIRNISHLENKMFAEWVGMNTLTQFQTGISKISRDLQSISDDTSLFSRQWHWQADFKPLFNGQVIDISIKVYLDGHPAALATVEGFLNAAP